MKPFSSFKRCWPLGLALLYLPQLAQAQPNVPIPPTVPPFVKPAPAEIEPAAKAAFEQLVTRYKTLKSYSGDLESSFTNNGVIDKQAVDDLNIKAHLSFEHPEKYRFEGTSKRGAFLGVSDGQTAWVVSPEHPKLYIQRAVKAAPGGEFHTIMDTGVGALSMGFLTGEFTLEGMQREGLTSLRMGADTTIDDQLCHVVDVNLTFDDGGSAATKLYIAPNGLLRRITQQYTGKHQGLIVDNHTNVEADTDLPASTWVFKASATSKPVEYFPPTDEKEYEPIVQPGDQLTDFSAFDVEGQPIKLSDYKGKVVVLQFFMMLGAGKSDTQNMLELQKQYSAQGLKVVGVSMDGLRDRVRQFVRDNAIDYPIVFDGGGWQNAVATQYGVRTVPTVFLIGRDGKLKKIGRSIPDLQVEGDLEAALKAPQ